MFHSGIHVAENGTVFAAGTILPTSHPFLLKLGQDGILLSNRTWSLTDDSWNYGFHGVLTVGPNGLAYMCGHGGRDYSELDVVAFGAGLITTGTTTSTTTVTTTGTTLSTTITTTNPENVSNDVLQIAGASVAVGLIVVAIIVIRIKR